MLPQNVQPERSHWRDERLSQLHRYWGWDVPCADIDWLVSEYDHGVTKALVEYKHHSAKEASSKHPSYRALKGLAEAAGVPFFAVRYDGDKFSWFRVTALNKLAHAALGGLQQTLDEYGYVSLMYEIRGRKPPEEQTVQEWRAEFELFDRVHNRVVRA